MSETFLNRSPDWENPEKTIERFRDPFYLPGYFEFMSFLGEYVKKLRNAEIPRAVIRDSHNSEVWEWGDAIGLPDNLSFLTREYIAAITSYLAERIEEIYSEKNKSVTITETGAGDGRLGFFIKKEFDEKYPDLVGKFTYLVTDINGQNEPFPVESQDYKQAIKGADIVVSSWMPSGAWPESYRKEPSVQEYILLGNVVRGLPFEEYDAESDTYHVDGFSSVELPEIGRWIINGDTYIGSDIDQPAMGPYTSIAAQDLDSEQITKAISFKRD